MQVFMSVGILLHLSGFGIRPTSMHTWPRHTNAMGQWSSIDGPDTLTPQKKPAACDVGFILTHQTL